MNSVKTRQGLAIEPAEDRTRGSGVVNRRIVLKKNPEGEPKPSDFEVVTEEVPPIAEGQMLLRTKWLTLDPYMRGLDASGPMNNKRNVGSTIVGGTVSEVVESRARAWNEGDLVVGYYGWQEYSVGTPEDLQWSNAAMPIEKWDGSLGPPSTALGILGMTGYAAYTGLLNVATIKAGETVVVSAASGAVGQVVGQLAKIHGARVVGIAGGPRKCAYCVDELGFDACIDYKAGDPPHRPGGCRAQRHRRLLRERWRRSARGGDPSTELRLPRAGGRVGEPIQHPEEQCTLGTTTGNTAEAAARCWAEGPRRGGLH